MALGPRFHAPTPSQTPPRTDRRPVAPRAVPPPATGRPPAAAGREHPIEAEHDAADDAPDEDHERRVESDAGDHRPPRCSVLREIVEDGLEDRVGREQQKYM